ncbi:hypothetical protein HDU78_007487 [Chytriomyces hyalinus]|nr:hypothetical protein HDU78_007487 [Chytriomyces hyalinus]
MQSDMQSSSSNKRNKNRKSKLDIPPIPDQVPEQHATDSSDMSKTANGACAELVNKRLRTLRKRLTKLESYESQPHDKLERDQVEALSKKPEVEASIKELEEVVKALTIAEVEEIKAANERDRLAKMTEELKVATAVMEHQNQERHRLKKSIELNFALSTLLPNISLINTSIRMSEPQFKALTDLRSIVLGNFPVSDTKNVLESAELVVSKYLNDSPDEFSCGITYVELGQLVSNLVTPPPLPKFGILAGVSGITNGFGAGFGLQDDSVGAGVYEMNGGHAEPALIAPVSRTISFFAHSE